ncbi:MAG: peptidoglycan editing factor PgeF [Gammaproteobacteria bacterium]|nr:peptidoglycan editing factor PgeF [Gammaproteobacteria bacterium]MBQ0839427.1 peptidoglycan editing factor PgeF [Gammaproteobacteria bacterium]
MYQYLIPDWPLPRGVRSVITTCQGQPHGAQGKLLNFLDDSDACRQQVWRNRGDLLVQLGLDQPPPWLVQEHGISVHDAAEAIKQPPPLNGDACVSRVPGLACVIQTADCLPVLLCNDAGSVVAAAHAGWRGLVAGVLAATVAAMDVEAATISAYLGPAISQQHFEVGAEVRAAFLAKGESADQVLTEACFIHSKARPGHFYADLYQLARIQLRRLGVRRIYGGGFCTYGDGERFYSYRREGQRTGRMASLIWIEN